MRIDIQYKIKSNPNYLKYLRENSRWYKYLNRHPNNFRQFENEVKDVYKLSTIDRVAKTMKMIEMFEKILSTIK